MKYQRGEIITSGEMGNKINKFPSGCGLYEDVSEIMSPLNSEWNLLVESSFDKSINQSSLIRKKIIKDMTSSSNKMKIFNNDRNLTSLGKI